VTCFTALAAGPLAVGVLDALEVLGADEAVVGVLAEVGGVLAVVLGWPTVAEVAAPASPPSPAAEAAVAPKAEKKTRQLKRARTLARRADEHGRRRFIAWRASGVLQMVPSGPASLS
jgi:hypothetical protein